MEHKQHRGRLKLLALILVFALPVLLAKIFLSQHWYQTGVSNRGELYVEYLTLDKLEQPNPYQQSQWQLVYVLPEQCDVRCEQQLHLLGQSQIALGRHQERVVAVLWQKPSMKVAKSEYPLSTMSPQLNTKVDEGDLVIVDPLGQLVMRYQTTEQTDPVQQSKDVLADLRKLLKLSRVG